jgi:beta-ribofuranosylaminobenzene 5'-phosphate synthase
MTVVSVSTPSRLHFGLLRVHESPQASFGGLGLMVDRPRVGLEIEAAGAWEVSGPAAERAAEFARRAVANLDEALRPTALRIRIHTAVPMHRGLGGGTQLALAIAAGVRRIAGLPAGTAGELAVAAGRGVRSAVGTHGFIHGGLIWERGRPGGELLAPLSDCVALPPEWRIVLIAPTCGEGLSGADEAGAFMQLPPVPVEVTSRLERLAEDTILPAARAGDFANFSEAVYEYGRTAGECFAPIQGGPYASDEIARTIDALRGLGVTGVGQSSWGPTVFAFAASVADAEELAARWRAQCSCETAIAAADNRGAIIEMGSQP